VWVVNRRVLVKQVYEVASKLVERFDEPIGSSKEFAQMLRSLCGDDCKSVFNVVQLRGQRQDDREWSLDPTMPQLIIGTFDQIGLRLLFQGYGLGKWSRPMHAGLLSVDAWVCVDEAHLVPSFAVTLRQVREIACRPLQIAMNNPGSAIAVFCFSAKEAADIAKKLQAKHRERVLLVTGRIRGYERDRLESNELFKRFRKGHLDSPTNPEPTFLVGTAAAEVGLDADASAIVCDFAGLPTLVQRLGRLDRRGQLSKQAFESNSQPSTMTIIGGSNGKTTIAQLNALTAKLDATRSASDSEFAADFLVGAAWSVVVGKGKDEKGEEDETETDRTWEKVCRCLETFPPLNSELHFVPISEAREWLETLPAQFQTAMAHFDGDSWLNSFQPDELSPNSVLVLPTSLPCAALDKIIPKGGNESDSQRC